MAKAPEEKEPKEGEAIAVVPSDLDEIGVGRYSGDAPARTDHRADAVGASRCVASAANGLGRA